MVSSIHESVAPRQTMPRNAAGGFNVSGGLLRRAPRPAGGVDAALPRRPGVPVRLGRSRRLRAGAAVFLLVLAAAVIGPAVAPHDPLEINPRLTLRAFAPG